MAGSEIQPEAGQGRPDRAGVVLLALILVAAVANLNLSVANVALPSIGQAFDSSQVTLNLIAVGYSLGLAASVLYLGAIGDRYGRKLLLVLGTSLAIPMSLLAAYAPSDEVLFVARVGGGVAAGMAYPTTLALITALWSGPARTTSIALWSALGGGIAALGPLVSGALLTEFDWGSVFLISVPVMVVLLIVAPLLLPEFRDPNAGRLDIYSATLSLGSVLALIYSLKRFAEQGLDPLAAFVFAEGLVLGWVFVRRQRRLVDPLIDVRLFRAPAFNVSLGLYMLATLVAFGAYIYIAQHLQLVLGLTPFAAGLATVPSMLGFVAGSLFVPMIVRRVSRATIMAAGLVLAAAGFYVLSLAAASTGLGALIAGSVIYSIGISPVVILATDLIVGSAPVEKAGAAAAISETSSELGGALGIAILGSIGIAVYRGVMAEALPAGLPSEIAVAARATLGGAVAVAETLGEPVRGELLQVARGAFSRAFELTAILSSVIALLLAPVAGRVLRKVRREAT